MGVDQQRLAEVARLQSLELGLAAAGQQLAGALAGWHAALQAEVARRRREQRTAEVRCGALWGRAGPPAVLALSRRCNAGGTHPVADACVVGLWRSGVRAEQPSVQCRAWSGACTSPLLRAAMPCCACAQEESGALQAELAAEKARTEALTGEVEAAAAGGPEGAAAALQQEVAVAREKVRGAGLRVWS